jgi:uncharacterized protein (TIGR02246 family)
MPRNRFFAIRRWIQQLLKGEKDMKRLLIIMVLMIISASYAQQNAEPPKGAPAVPAGAFGFKAEVQKIADDWKAAFQAKDADKIASLYTEDSVYINPEGSYHGPVAIKTEISKVIARGDTVDAIITERAFQDGDVAISVGKYAGRSPNASGKERLGHGHWIVSLKNSNGMWRIATHTAVAAGARPAKMKKKAE